MAALAAWCLHQRRQSLHADPVPNELLSIMDDVATAKISHEGSAL
jgi:hypothetical protein